MNIINETLQKRLNRYFNSYKVFASGDFIPKFPSSAKLRECEQTRLIVYWLRTDSVVYFEMLCAPKRLVSDYFISQNNFKFWGASFPRPHTRFLGYPDTGVPRPHTS